MRRQKRNILMKLKLKKIEIVRCSCGSDDIYKITTFNVTFMNTYYKTFWYKCNSCNKIFPKGFIKITNPRTEKIFD